MDPLGVARNVLKRILAEHQTLEAQSRPDSIQSHFIEDDHAGEYLIVHTGFDSQTRRRVYGVVFHVWLKDGKIWVERDNVFPSITGEMVERGVPKELFTYESYPVAAEPTPA